MVSQLRRCSSSVAANVAEGCGRSGNPELARFLVMAMGSASELEYFLLLVRVLQYLPDDRHQAISNEVERMRRMLNRLISKVAGRGNKKLEANCPQCPTRALS